MNNSNNKDKSSTEEMGKHLLELLTEKTNRSKAQTTFLFELVDFDFNKLVLLEEKLKNNFCFYCPANKEEVLRVLSLDNNKNNYFSLSEFKYNKK